MIRNIIINIKNIIILTKKLIVDKPDIIYFQITPNGIGFLRDSVYILLIKLFQVSLVLHFRGKGVRASSTTVLQRKYYKFIITGTSILCHTDIVAKDFTIVLKVCLYIL